MKRQARFDVEKGHSKGKESTDGRQGNSESKRTRYTFKQLLKK